MFNLRTRLMASYILLLVVTVGGIVIAFFVATSAQPAPPQQTYQRLAGIAQGLNLQQFLSELGSPLGGQRPQLGELLGQVAESRGVRVMAINLDQRRVIYDSAGTLGRNEVLRLERENYRFSRPLGPGIEFIAGRFEDDGQEWLFTGVTSIQPITRQQRLIVVADTPSTQSLQRALTEIGSELALPLLQASIIGLVIAVIMAVVISRTIAHPLQAASNAATAVAKGDLNQRVPVSGPPEVRAVAEAFNRMSAEVRATQQAQRDFMMNVSHDLKTPLTSIEGYSQAIIDGTSKDPRHAAEIIHDEASRLDRMVIELTDLARLEVGQLSMNAVPLDLGQIAATVAQKLAVVAEQKNIRLEVDTPSMPTVIGDGDRIVQVLNNLIGNAIKFTPQGGRVSVETRANHDGVEVVVADTGIGISERDLPRVFERFYQADRSRGPARGTGLGLAIAREIVQAHSGRIDVQSAEDEGTTFRVRFPLAQPDGNGRG